MHFERIEVVTSSDGSSSLQLDLACETALSHYARCTESGRSQERPQPQEGLSTSGSEVCSTGLRVYQGAHVLAAFLAKFGRCLLPDLAECHGADGAKPWAVELGCGCGLVGLTVAKLFPQLSVAFTDASEDCLSLVSATVERLALPLVRADSGDFPGPVVCDGHGRTLLSCELKWCEEGANRLLHSVGQLSPSVDARRPANPIRLVLGSDLMYYRVDIRELLTTCKALLRPCGDTDGDTARCEGGPDRCFPRLAVLAHFMRIPDGDRKLQSCAHELGLGAVRVPLDAFLEPRVVQSRGWSGTAVVLLFIRPSAAAGSCRRPTVGDTDADEEWRKRWSAADLTEARTLLGSEQFSSLRRCLTGYFSAAAVGCSPMGGSVVCGGLENLPFAV